MQTECENVFDLDPDASYRFKQELLLMDTRTPYIIQMQFALNTSYNNGS